MSAELPRSRAFEARTACPVVLPFSTAAVVGVPFWRNAATWATLARANCAAELSSLPAITVSRALCYTQEARTVARVEVVLEAPVHLPRGVPSCIHWMTRHPPMSTRIANGDVLSTADVTPDSRAIVLDIVWHRVFPAISIGRHAVCWWFL